MEQSLLPIIRELETYANEHHLNHRFVGGVSFGGLLTEKTTYQIDVKKHLIYLKHHSILSSLRSDGTVKDIDIILFCENIHAIDSFKLFVENIRQKYRPVPAISVEATAYPLFGRRNLLTQFVTTYEVNKQGQLFLTFDSLSELISWESVEPWTVVLEDETTFTVRNPIADFYAYSIRGGGVLKPKDKKKINFLKELAAAVYAEGMKHHINYYSKEYYKPWESFMHALETSKDRRIATKRTLLKIYWRTIGTAFAHGRGLTRVFSPLSNQFTGTKQ